MSGFRSTTTEFLEKPKVIQNLEEDSADPEMLFVSNPIYEFYGLSGALHPTRPSSTRPRPGHQVGGSQPVTVTGVESPPLELLGMETSINPHKDYKVLVTAKKKTYH